MSGSADARSDQETRLQIALAEACRRLAALNGEAQPLPSDTAEVAALTGRDPAAMVERLDQQLALLEDRMDRVTNADQVEKLKNEFVMNISHELRTPLASIEGFAKALLRGLEEPQEGSGERMSLITMRQFLEIISREAGRLGGLIEDVLELTKIEAEPRNQDPQRFLVREVYEAAAITFRTRWGDQAAAKIKLRLSPEGEGPEVYGNRGALSEILRHLLDNAQKFSGGQEVELGARPNPLGDHVQLWVRDRGIGIPDGHKSRIFRKFYRIDATAHTVPGTGLGLAIVKTLVEQNRGTITVETEVGQGAKFIIDWPASKQAWNIARASGSNATLESIIDVE